MAPSETLDLSLREPYASMHPPDAVVALRSLPRRWRELTAEAEAEADDAETELDELARRRPAADRPSALEHATAAARQLATAPDAARDVRLRDRPRLDLAGTAGPEPDPDAGFERVVEVLARAATALADELDDVPAAAWARTGELDGRAVDLRTLTRAWVQAGLEHLRDARSALRDARRLAG